MGDPDVLVVEDDEDRALLVERAFSQVPSEPTVEVVGSAEEAVDRLQGADASWPRLVLLDLGLPGQDGFAVLEAIEGDEAIPRVPVVVLTNREGTEDMLKSYELGANGYVVKPVDFDEFRQAISRIARFWLEINLPPPDVEAY